MLAREELSWERKGQWRQSNKNGGGAVIGIE